MILLLKGDDLVEMNETLSNSEKDILREQQQSDFAPGFNRKRPEPRITTRSLLYIMLSLISIMMITMIIAGIWYVKRQDALYQNMILTIDVLTSDGEYSEAEIEAKRNQFRWDGLSDAIRKSLQARIELKAIAQRRQEDLLKNGITIGRDAKDFEGLQLDKIVEDLIKRGFEKEKIIISPLVVSAKEYKKVDAGNIIGVRINGMEKFAEKDKFFADSVIEIYIKEVSDASTPNENEQNDIDDNKLTVGMKSSDLEGLSVDEAKDKLVYAGFSEENITISQSDTKNPIIRIRYRNAKEPVVIGIRIAGKDKFKADDHFSKDEAIVLYVYQQ